MGGAKTISLLPKFAEYSMKSCLRQEGFSALLAQPCVFAEATAVCVAEGKKNAEIVAEAIDKGRERCYTYV